MTDDTTTKWASEPARGIRARGPEDHEHVERPPFADKNLAALKIGSRSPRVYGKVAEGIVAELLEAEPHLAQFPEELAALAQTEAIVALIRLDLAARGLRNPDGSERGAFIDRWLRAEAAAAKRRDAVGLSPLGNAVLAKERAAAAAGRRRSPPEMPAATSCRSCSVRSARRTRSSARRPPRRGSATTAPTRRRPHDATVPPPAPPARELAA